MLIFHIFCIFTRVYSVMAGLGRVRVFFFRAVSVASSRRKVNGFFRQVCRSRLCFVRDSPSARFFARRSLLLKKNLCQVKERSGLDGLRPSKDNIFGYLVDFRSVNWIWLDIRWQCCFLWSAVLINPTRSNNLGLRCHRAIGSLYGACLSRWEKG